MTNEILLALFGLIVILLMIFLLAWLLKKSGIATGQFGFMKKDSHIEVVESRLLDGRNRLYHIRWQNQDFLIGANPSGIALIGGRSPESNSSDFQEHLRNTQEKAEPSASDKQD